MPDLDPTVSALVDHIVAAKPALDPASVRADSSLTADLGFDSFDLVELAGRLGDRYESVDLLPWFAGAMDSGGDRVDSLAAYLLDHVAGRLDPAGGGDHRAAPAPRRNP